MTNQTNLTIEANQTDIQDEEGQNDLNSNINQDINTPKIHQGNMSNSAAIIIIEFITILLFVFTLY